MIKVHIFGTNAHQITSSLGGGSVYHVKMSLFCMLRKRRRGQKVHAPICRQTAAPSARPSASVRPSARARCFVRSFDVPLFFLRCSSLRCSKSGILASRSVGRSMQAHRRREGEGGERGRQGERGREREAPRPLINETSSA